MTKTSEQTGLATTSNEPVTIQQLYKDTALQLQRDQLQTFLNQDPPSDWVKEHPNIKGHKYVPIDKVEWMLSRFFKKKQIEVKEYKQLLNAISVSVRVHYLDPITNEMTFEDGVGAWDLQTQSGTGVLKLDASNINRGAVPMALGIAESIAIKDACDKIGPIFGSNLNRKDTMPNLPDAQLSDIVNQKEHERMLKLIDKATTRAELEEFRPHLTDALKSHFETKYNSVK